MQKALDDAQNEVKSHAAKAKASETLSEQLATSHKELDAASQKAADLERHAASASDQITKAEAQLAEARDQLEEQKKKASEAQQKLQDADGAKTRHEVLVCAMSLALHDQWLASVTTSTASTLQCTIKERQHSSHTESKCYEKRLGVDLHAASVTG